MKPICVALFMDSPLVRDACAFRLAAEKNIRVVATGRPTATALGTLRKSCNVAVIEADLSRRHYQSLAALRMKRPDTRIVLFSQTVSDRQIARGIQLGMRGYVTPEIRLDELVQGVRRVAEGGFVFARKVKSRLIVDPKDATLYLKPNVDVPKLSDDQLEILRLLSLGHSTLEIADLMNRSAKSIESMKYRLMNRLGLHNRVMLARYAVREGLIRL